MVVATSSLITSACCMRCKHIICKFSLRNASFAHCRQPKKLPIRTGSVAADHAHLKKRAGEARLRNFNSPWSSAPGDRINRARALGVVDCEEGCETLSKKCCQPPRARATFSAAIVHQVTVRAWTPTYVWGCQWQPTMAEVILRRGVVWRPPQSSLLSKTRS